MNQHDSGSDFRDTACLQTRALRLMCLSAFCFRVSGLTLFRKLVKSDSSKTCIPGSFPEGKAAGSGRQTGRSFLNIMFSGPELERETRGFQPASPRKISRLPGRETEGCPKGKISKVTFSGTSTSPCLLACHFLPRKSRGSRENVQNH